MSKICVIKLSVSSAEYGHSIHYVRNIIGRLTYGLIGLDKLLENDKVESKRFLDSFLSLVKTETPRSSSQGTAETRRLLPEVEYTIRVYDPEMKEKLLTVASEVRGLADASPSREEIQRVYDQLEALLDKMYERTSNITKPSALD